MSTPLGHYNEDTQLLWNDILSVSTCPSSSSRHTPSEDYPATLHSCRYFLHECSALVGTQGWDTAALVSPSHWRRNCGLSDFVTCPKDPTLSRACLPSCLLDLASSPTFLKHSELRSVCEVSPPARLVLAFSPGWARPFGQGLTRKPTLALDSYMILLLQPLKC